ncbi:MAG TPA: phage terminase large subunit [Candidatus Angelobacter sp.]|nr:phage terminase large subunit [Candidatus Angelobacter sp.]
MKTQSPQKPKAAKPRSRKPAAESQVVEPLAEEQPTASTEERAKCEKSLKDFVIHAWPILEPVAPLQWNWHLDLICEYLTVIRDNNFRSALGAEVEGVIFNVPPRTMKSSLVTIMFPVWVWTTDPARRFMFVSYSEKLSTQHSVYRRNVIESDWYQGHWKDVFSFAKDQNLKSHYENSARGAMFSTAMQATATGLGGDILIFDDPLNPEQALSQVERDAVNLRFDSTFRSRLNNPRTGVKIIVMQRLDERDLTGHVLAREAKRWQHVSLPARFERAQELLRPHDGGTYSKQPGELLWEDRLPESVLEGCRTGMGSWAFHSQYQQEPAPMDAGIIQRQWVRYYRELPRRFEFLVQSWDCTFKASASNDFVAGQVWGHAGGKYYMLPYRLYERLDFGPTKAAIKACHAKFPAASAVLIEDKANGPAIISELRHEIAGVVAVTPEGGKLTRAHAMAPLWESGSVELPDPQVFDVPWMEDYIRNICSFPKAVHDDDMDATSQALTYMRNRLGGGIIEFYRREGKTEERQAIIASEHIRETALTPCVIDAVAQGSQIHCSARQYPEVRQALMRAAREWDERKDGIRSLLALNEVLRLDSVFGV